MAECNTLGINTSSAAWDENPLTLIYCCSYTEFECSKYKLAQRFLTCPLKQVNLQSDLCF